MEKLKPHLPLIVGLGIPVFMVLLIAGLTYMPQFFNPVEPPQYDFIYAEGDGVVFGKYPGAYTYPSRGVWPKYRYQVVDGKLTKIENKPVTPGYENMPIDDVFPKFYIHHVATNQSESLTLEEAQQYVLDSGAKSPDGFEVVRGTGGGGVFPFFYEGRNNYDKKYIQKEYYSEEVNLNLSRDYYQDFFVAWVMK